MSPYQAAHPRAVRATPRALGRRARRPGAPRRRAAAMSQQAAAPEPAAMSEPGDSVPGMEAAGGSGAGTLDCVVEFVLFVREDGYTAVRAAPLPAGGGPITAVGHELAGARPGETLRLTGAWTTHRVHGPRFEAATCERRPPRGVRAIRMYLGSGLVRGIGPLLAQAITDRFGEDTLTVIEHEPARLAEVYGIGERRTRRITESWRTQQTIKELMGVLRGYG